MSLYQTLTSEDFPKYRLYTDSEIDDLWQTVGHKEIWDELSNITSNKLLFESTTFRKLVRDNPDWLIHQKITQGQEFFQSHCREIMGLLGFASLPYCYTHINGAKVLIQSGRLSSDANRRLLETATFVFDCCRPDAFSVEGVGFVSALKVRLIHSLIRLKVSDNWDIEANGSPVNQMDMAGTNLAFSLISLRGMRKLGFLANQTDAEAYLHLWNYISYLLGLSSDLIPQNMKEAHWLSKIIFEEEAGYSENGQVLTQSMIQSMEEQPELRSLKGLIEPLISYCLGPECSRCLGLTENPTINLKGLVKLLNWFSATVLNQNNIDTIKTFDQEIDKMEDRPSLSLPKP